LDELNDLLATEKDKNLKKYKMMEELNGKIQNDFLGLEFFQTFFLVMLHLYILV
jgi:hypothetical protein